MDTTVVIPTRNAESYLPLLLAALKRQTLAHKLIIIDSDSSDNTRSILQSENIPFVSINSSEFNHGTTRNLGLNIVDTDTVVFMTQDALPVNSYSLEKLVLALYKRNDVAMAYGRQIPYQYTNIWGKIARLFNYPNQTIIKDKSLIPVLGIKTCSSSNSFAAYFRTDLEHIGGFPNNLILGEDVSVAANFILSGKAVVYTSEACVFHSHDYSLFEEFKRYFDIGVFHYSQRRLLKEFSKAESQGFRYVIDEWKHLYKTNNILLLPSQLLRTILKYIGYKLGRSHSRIPVSVKKVISMHSSYWTKI